MNLRSPALTRSSKSLQITSDTAMNIEGLQELQTDIQMAEMERCVAARVEAVEARALAALQRAGVLEQRMAQAEGNVTTLLNVCLEAHQQLHGRVLQLEAAVAVAPTPMDAHALRHRTSGNIKTTTSQQTFAEEVTKEDLHDLSQQFHKLEKAMRHYMDLLFPDEKEVVSPLSQEDGQMKEKDILIADPVRLRLHFHDQNSTTPLKDSSQKLERASIDSGRFSSYIENQLPEISFPPSILNASLSEISHATSIPVNFPENSAHSIIVQSTIDSSCTVPEENSCSTFKDNKVSSRNKAQHPTSTKETTSAAVPANEQDIYVNVIPTLKPRSDFQQNTYNYVYDTRRKTPLEKAHLSEVMNDIKNEVPVTPNISSDCTKTLSNQSELVSSHHEPTKNPVHFSLNSPSNETIKEKLQSYTLVIDPHSKGVHNTFLTTTTSMPDVTSMNSPTPADVHTLKQIVSSPRLSNTVTPSKPSNPTTNFTSVCKTSLTTNSDQSSYELYDKLPHSPPIAVDSANVARQANSRASTQVATPPENGERQQYTEETFRFSETQAVTEESLESGYKIHSQPTSTAETIRYVHSPQMQNPSSAEDEYSLYSYADIVPKNHTRNNREFSIIIAPPLPPRSAITPSLTLPNALKTTNVADQTADTAESVRNSAEEKYSPVTSPAQKASISAGSCLSLNTSPSTSIINSDCLASQRDYIFSEINGVETPPLSPNAEDLFAKVPTSIVLSASASTVSGSPATDKSTPENVSELLGAAKNGDHRKCGKILRANSPSIVSARDAAGDTAVHVAANEGHLKALETLLAAGAPASERGAGGSSPLHYAAAAGHDRCIAALLAAGAAPDARSSVGSTPLHLAAQLGRGSSVKALLAKGADARLRNNEGFIPRELTKDTGLRKMLWKAEMMMSYT